MAYIKPSVLLYIGFASTGVIISAIGNILIIIVILKNKHMRTATNLFICNLAGSDFFMGAVVLPQNIHDLSHTGDYDEGVILCKIVTAVPIICITCSIFSLVAMAIERYRAICTTAGVMSIPAAKRVMALCWFGAIMVSLPSMIEYGVKREYFEGYGFETTENSINEESTTSKERQSLLVDDAATTLSINSTTPLPYIRVCGNIMGRTYGLLNGTFLVLFAYLTPLATIVFCYIKVGYFLIIKSKEQTQGTKGQTFSVTKNKVRILQMLVVVAALFAICWCPYFVILLNAKITGSDDTGDATSPLNLLKLSLSIFSVTYNIYLYIYYTASFRIALKMFLCPHLKMTAVAPEGNTAFEQTNAFEQSVVND